jgi:glycosyltransferase involved in cell wall biosynthesis
MRIAQIAPLAEAVPPYLYGGTERVVSLLTERLVHRGHDVTLFASGDSRTSARLFACAPRALRLDPRSLETIGPTLVELAEVYRRAGEFDVIHNHADYFAFPFSRLTTTPTVTTAHFRLDLPEIADIYEMFREQNLVSVSRDQASYLPDANWVANIPHAINLDNFHYQSEPGDYLVFLGRMSPEKRPDRAIAIAREVGMRLVVAAKIDRNDREYYETVVRPLIDAAPFVESIGEVDEARKDRLLGGAYASLFPIDWPEPFGLTTIESLATGTPVIAMRRGSIPEVMADGVTGFICDSVDEMIGAVGRIGEVDRAACREHVERNFSPELMTSRYEEVYRRLAEDCPSPLAESAAPAR